MKANPADLSWSHRESLRERQLISPRQRAVGVVLIVLGVLVFGVGLFGYMAGDLQVSSLSWLSDQVYAAQEAAQRLQDVLDPSTGEVEEVQELERQHRTLTSEVEGLKQRIAQAEEETQKHAQRLREIESQADEVKLATAEIQKCMGEAQIAIQHALIETGVSQMMQAKQNKQRQTPDTKPQRGKGNFRK